MRPKITLLVAVMDGQGAKKRKNKYGRRAKWVCAQCAVVCGRGE